MGNWLTVQISWNWEFQGIAWLWHESAGRRVQGIFWQSVVWESETLKGALRPKKTLDIVIAETTRVNHDRDTNFSSQSEIDRLLNCWFPPLISAECIRELSSRWSMISIPPAKSFEVQNSTNLNNQRSHQYLCWAAECLLKIHHPGWRRPTWSLIPKTSS